MNLLERQSLRQAKRRTIHYAPSSPVQALLRTLLDSSIILEEDWHSASEEVQAELEEAVDVPMLLSKLVKLGLLTDYQASRIGSDRIHGLVLGNYRVLDELGSGGMSIVYRGKHRYLHREVAIKVLDPVRGHHGDLLERFMSEMRAISHLQHPNIVSAPDAGKIGGAGPGAPPLYYLVMEFVPGQDLEAYVETHGALPVEQACELVHQVALALEEAHQQGLVHRDLKPSNVMVTPANQAKLLDFGLVHRFHHRMTMPSIPLGTIDYMAPEQARDAGSVDIRADIYGLGGILFWCLTGQSPFPVSGSITEALARRLCQQPPSARELRPEIPPGLDAVVARMLALDPAERFATPRAVAHALSPYLGSALTDGGLPPLAARGESGGTPALEQRALPVRPRRVLIVDDEASIRTLCQHLLPAREGFQCDVAADGEEALRKSSTEAYELVVLDVDMPGIPGTEVCRRLRQAPPSAHLKIIMISGRVCADELAEMVMAGADDYLTKPLSLIQLQTRVKTALQLKDSEERSSSLHQQLLAVNRDLGDKVYKRDRDLVRARNGLVLALAKCVESRDGETGMHLMRLQHYSRCLAEAAACVPTIASRIDSAFIETLECCAPLHDIGKIGIPDSILLKPGRLTPEERILIQAHTTIGADTLRDVALQHGSAMSFLPMAIEIARHHHERYDGNGYPDRLIGDAIPLSARMVTLCDVYDALRSRRVYKPALSHGAVLQIMLENSPGQFDPALLAIFHECAPQFDRIFREQTD
jgi:response regulator RpfG family c-di-GMP phosphodiesterase